MSISSNNWPPKEHKKVVEIYKAIGVYWKNTNDFVVAHIRFLQDMNYKHGLELSEDLLSDLPYLILTPLLSKGLSQSNSMYIFAQFVVLFILRGENPKNARYSDINLTALGGFIPDIITNCKSSLTPEFSMHLEYDSDYSLLLDPNEEANNTSSRNEHNRLFSEKILANRMSCAPHEVRQKVIEQFTLNNASLEDCEKIILKHKQTKNDQAKQYEIHPDDTPAALIIEYIKDYIKTIQPEEGNDDSIFSELSNMNPELMNQLLSALSANNMEVFNRLIEQNPKFLQFFMDKLK